MEWEQCGGGCEATGRGPGEVADEERGECGHSGAGDGREEEDEGEWMEGEKR